MVECIGAFYVTFQTLHTFSYTFICMLYFTNFTFLLKNKRTTSLASKQALCGPWYTGELLCRKATLLDLLRGLDTTLTSKVAPAGLPLADGRCPPGQHMDGLSICPTVQKKLQVGTAHKGHLCPFLSHTVRLSLSLWGPWESVSLACFSPSRMGI